MPRLATFRTGYIDHVIADLPNVIDEAHNILAGVDFDTLVGTGFSGGIVIPALAATMGKHFVLIRKETDDSHHGPGRLLGNLGARWIFVDDFVSSGRTKRRVVDKIADAATCEGHHTTYVGDYLYAGHGNKLFTPAHMASWGYAANRIEYTAKEIF